MSSTVPDDLKEKVRVQARYRCGYCLAQQQYLPLTLEIEHIIPRSKGGTDEEINLWLACRSCNLYKSNKIYGIDPVTGRRVRLFNPRTQLWNHHFHWNEDGVLKIGFTPIGRATTIALNLNNLIAVTVRHNWVSAGWHPPQG